MLESMNNITITVQRRTSASKNSYGEKVYAVPTTIYSNIGCRYDDYGGKTDFNEQGERIVSTRNILVDPMYLIYEEDLVTISYDNIQRRVIKIMPSWGPLNILFANELMLLDP